MQNTEAGTKSKSRSDEESINFRPSPNFKHMKKYLKSKFEEANGVENNETEKDQNAQKAPNEQQEEKYPIKTSPGPQQTTVIQPPLPPNTPPPGSPLAEIKQELIDDDYQQYCTTGIANNEDAYADYNATAEQQEQEFDQKASGAEVTMCRNFARGTCKKGASCIFAHEVIVSQLSGVYTFCRNFQNRQCTFAKCKFVHATVFEKECFFRTGYLPPHTIAHLKAAPATTATATATPAPPTVPPPPPPPPPPEETELSETEVQQGYYTAASMDTNTTSMQSMGIDCTAIPSYMLQSSLATGIDPSFYGPSTSTGTITSPTLKRDWNEAFPMAETTYTEADFSTGDTLLKKCKSCDSNEFRYQYHKNKVENMISATDDVNKKLAQLNAKNQRLCTVLVTLFKPQTLTPTPGLSSLTSAFEDKDKNVLEQINLLMGNRTSTMAEEESMKNMLGSNFNLQLLMNILMSTAEQPQPQ